MNACSRFFAYHTDIARGAYFRPDAFKQVLGYAADAGFTHVVPYLENMIALPAIARACPACAYSPETWHEFEAAARAVGIDLIPHVNVIGHSAAVCRAYPELAGAAGSTELDVTAEAVRTWTRAALEQFCDIAGSHWFLIGGDEWLAPAHLLKDPDFNVARAWAGQINLAVETLVARQRTPIVWHDMLMHYPEALESLSRDAVIAFWFYDVDSDYAAIRLLQDHGFRVIMAGGTSGGFVSRRRQNAVAQALRTVRETHAAGFMMTSWEKQRFEDQKLITHAVGNLARGRTVPDAITRFDDVFEACRGMTQPIDALTPHLQDLQHLLSDPAWDDFPLARRRRRHWLERNTDADLESFTRHHYPEGPLYTAIGRRELIAPPHRQSGLSVDVEPTEREGACLTVRNGAEHFRLYPRFGPTLQDWCIADQTIIPHSLPAFLAKGDPVGGGYRSYSGVGGLRPIWALGTHHNPCIIWQHPWDWEIVEATSECLHIRLARSFHHVDLAYTLTVRNGTPGFRIDLAGVNKLAHARVGLNWNLCLHFTPDDLPHTMFHYRRDDVDRRLRMTDELESAFLLVNPGPLTLSTAHYRIEMQPDPATTHGYFVDWSPTLITPDLRSTYQPIDVGRTLATSWSFRAHPRHAADMQG